MRVITSSAVASWDPQDETAVELLAKAGMEVRPTPDDSRQGFSDRLDTALMALFRDRREVVAFELLYLRARGGIFDSLRRAVAQRRVAIDPLELLQDTFVNVYRYAGGFRDEHAGSFRAWSRTIAHHTLARASMRRRLRVVAWPEGMEDPVDPCAQPTRSLADHEETDSLAQSWMLFLAHYQRAYLELSPRDRRALELVEVEGLSYGDAARELAVGRSNMKMILFRARSRIQARMARSMGLPKSALRAAV